MTTRSTELAWAAGLFVGEGCVTVEKPSPQNIAKNKLTSYIAISVGMGDERAVRRWVEIVRPLMQPKQGGVRDTTISVRRREPRLHQNKPSWVAVVRNKNALRILSAMWPYLEGTDKGDQALKCAAEAGAIHLLRTVPDVEPEAQDDDQPTE